MKKLILFLLLPLWAIAQTSTTQEQEFDYGIKNNSAQTITTPPYLTTTGMDGTQGKIPSALIEKTDNKQNSLAVDGTGTKYPTVDAVNAALPKTYATIVYVNTTSPATASVFDDENPPTVNDDTLKNDADNLYIGLDASTWVYNGSIYVTKSIPDGSNFFIRGTTVDAGNSKTENIERIGSIKTSQTLDAGNVNAGNIIANSIISSNETANTIASFDDSKQIKSLPTTTYPSLTELSYIKGVTGGIQAQIDGKQNTLTNQITGTLTTNYIPKATGSGTLGNSTLREVLGEINIMAPDVNGFGILNKTNNQFNIASYSGSVFENVVIKGDGFGDIVIFEHNTKNALFAGSISATSYTGSATLTGTPTAPTAAVGTSTTQIATTRFVSGEIAANGYWTKTGDDIANNNTGLVNIGSFSTPYDYKLKVAGGIVSNNNIYAESYWIDNGCGMFRGSNTYELSFRAVGTNWFTFTRPEGFSNESGTINILRINPSFSPTSGTAVVNFSNINPIINQTGGANGITRGIYINPTLTSAFDFRAIEVTAGKVIVPVTIETSVQEYADNAAALSAGLTIGTHYRTGDLLKIVH